jgi:hypothetical protein
MKLKLLLMVASILPLFGDEGPPQTVTIEGRSPATLTNLDYMWFRPGFGCDILNYHLFEYTDRHPDRVKFEGDDEVATIEGFFDYLATVSPIFVSGFGGDKYSLIFFRGAILTPWGDEILFLIDRNKDGYLTAFGDRRSVNEVSDPWKKEGFKYTKAVGITLKKRPSFMGEGKSVIVSLNDNDYSRLNESILPQKNDPQQDARGNRR